MPPPLGYVVIEWNQASRRPGIADGALWDKPGDAQTSADGYRSEAARNQRGETYTVHAVNPCEEPT